MKRMKRVLALLLVLAMTLSLAACGGGGGTSGGNSSVDPDKLIAEAEKKVADAKSMEADMTMKMEMSAEGETMVMDIGMKMTMMDEPLLLKMDMDMTMNQNGKEQSQSIYMYGEAQDDKMMRLYMSLDNAVWMKQTVEAGDLAQYEAKDDMGLYLKSGTDFKRNGTEKVNGSDAYRLDGVVGKEYITEVLESSGALEQLSTLLPDKDGIDAMLKDVADMPLSIWIDKESGYPVKYSMDMGPMMQNLFSKIFEAAGQADLDFKVSAMTLEMTCSKFGKVEAFEIPEAARNGQETALGL